MSAVNFVVSCKKIVLFSAVYVEKMICLLWILSVHCVAALYGFLIQSVTGGGVCELTYDLSVCIVITLSQLLTVQGAGYNPLCSSLTEL